VAQKLMRERQKLDSSLSSVTRIGNELDDAVALIEMAEGENDAAMVTDAETALLARQARAEQMRLESMLAAADDGNEGNIEIHAASGGSEGRTLRVKGDSAYGWLKTEAGVHRLVRISPFDSNARRHTSFSSVTVYPVIDQSIEIDIPEKDVRIDVYRASGAGGQHVNKTESAVRITHLPTGIAVASQSERSQHQNRAICWDMLKSRLYEIELEKKKAETGAFVGEKKEIGWGHQIRSYVLQPYQLVKDLRTGVESRTPSDVLDGDLDAFMAAALAQEVGGKPREMIEDIE